ncbi:unnamed protein product [Lepidochelys kempii]
MWYTAHVRRVGGWAGGAAGAGPGPHPLLSAMSDGFRKAESGTQLLARLEGRSSLKNLEPCLFADEGFPIHGKTVP